jgi:ArsR family transcriptional regulator, arsenate/arsenite/antimonite-responsive transcriptional repressor
MDRGKALAALSALANETRLDLVRLLVVAGDDGLPAGDLARALDHSASRLSFHLAQLEQAGLVTSRRVARNIYYAVDPAGMGGTIGYLMADCCQGHPKVMACCRRAQTDGAEVTVPLLVS